MIYIVIHGQKQYYPVTSVDLKGSSLCRNWLSAMISRRKELGAGGNNRDSIPQEGESLHPLRDRDSPAQGANSLYHDQNHSRKDKVETGANPTRTIQRVYLRLRRTRRSY
jgi:hypothetical protein